MATTTTLIEPEQAPTAGQPEAPSMPDTPHHQPPPDRPPEVAERPERWSPGAITRSGWITAAIAALTAVLYSWNLSVNGYANEYYTAAITAGSQSWKAFFFGSIDPGNFITVDKPPAALWLPSLSARLFGVSSWSVLLPEVVMGVVSVLILHRLVRRWAGDTAAHLAALALAVTPVAALMFRFNNPDALLTVLCLGAAWALWSALETGRTRGLVLSAVLMGFAFNTKMLQAFLVLPAFILVYVIAGKPRFWRRIAQLAAALVTLVVASGWWIAAVALWPSDSRPYIGSTSDNSILSLLFGYNGFARVFGSSGSGPGGGGAPGGGGPGGGAGFGGASGWLRMFNAENIGQIAWLIPLAAAGLLAGLWLTRRNPRTDLARAGWILWGGWGLTCFVVFSRAQGIFHSYYTVQLAPAVAALAGAGGVALWRLGRQNRWWSWALPATIVATAALAVGILNLTPAYAPWLRTLIIVAALIGAAGIWLGSSLRQRPVVLIAAGAAVIALLAGPTAYSLTTVNQSASGSIVLAGPSSGTSAGPGGLPGGGAAGPGGGGGMPGMGATTADANLISYLQANQGDATYLVAAFGSHSSAPIIIASGQPVITIGGFNGADPAPTLAQFQALVSSGAVRYVLVGGGGPGGGAGGPGGGGPGASGSGQSIQSWVTQNGTQIPASTYGGSGNGGTLYDLSGAA